MDRLNSTIDSVNAFAWGVSKASGPKVMVFKVTREYFGKAENR